MTGSQWVTAVLVLGMAGASMAQTPKAVKVQMETSSESFGGTVWLVQEKKDVKFIIKLKNLDPGQHAIHIHQNPACDAPEFKTAGGHFNPSGKQHGLQNPAGHHAGDLPLNLDVRDDGTAMATFTSTDVTLDPKAPNSVFANGGTSIIVHKGPDDMKTDPSGNSGARESCGIVSIKNIADKVQSTEDAHQQIGEPSSNH